MADLLLVSCRFMTNDLKAAALLNLLISITLGQRLLLLAPPAAST